MNRILGYAGLIAALALPFTVNAQGQEPPPQSGHYGPHEGWNQNHGEIQAYGDLFRVNPKGGSAVNFLGFGGRVGFNVHPTIGLEAEMNYDFAQNYTTVSTNGNTTGVTSTTITGRTRPISGLFGPKFQVGASGPFHAFVTGKVGFMEFSHSTSTASGTTFANSFDQFGGGTTHVAVYPGGGIEGYFGSLGLRVEAGDEIYFKSGTYNNLRIAFGPTLRF